MWCVVCAVCQYALAVAALLLPLLTLATMPISIGYINLVTCVEKMKKDGPLTEVMCAHIYVYVYTCIYVYTHVYVYVYTCIYEGWAAH